MTATETMKSLPNDSSATMESKSTKKSDLKESTPQTTAKIDSKARQPQRPNYHELHGRPLPLSVYPLPILIPHNPISLLHIAYAVLRDWFSPPSSHPTELYRGYYSSATQSVHVTDPKTVRALWEMGFFGKGNLSRSEPNWLDLERRRLGLVAFMTSEERTAARRKAREEFKRERARLEREALEEQKRKEAVEANGLSCEPMSKPAKTPVEGPVSEDRLSQVEGERYDSVSPEAQTKPDNRIKEQPKNDISTRPLTEETIAVASEQKEPINQEHLQLPLVEAFYLSYAVGALEIIDPATGTAIKDNNSLLQLCRQKSYFPPALPSQLKPDDAFLLSYVVYHHFRSLGWVVREGVKFAVDYLLYERGPVFMHAHFAVVIVPSYTNPYWFATPERAKDVEKKMGRKSWHWMHCANRVQGNVVKTLVLAYVDVPAPSGAEGEDSGQDIGKLLQRYKIREFCLRRWSANRNRD